MSAVIPVSARAISTGVVFAMLLSLIGCGGPAEETTPGDVGVVSTNLQDSQDACRTRLDGAIGRLKPDSLRSISRLSTSVGALNAWLVECAADELTALEVSDANLAFLDSTAHRSVSAPRYTARDAAYIRDSMVAARLAQALVGRAEAAGVGSDIGRLVYVFRWVGNNISLKTPEEPEASEGFLDTLLLGRGTVRSRIWVLAALFRQLQRDVVILVPNGSDPEDLAEQSLLAVCMDDRILLFDPQTWLPVAAAGDESVWIDEPAGIEFLNASEQWKEPNLLMIAETSTVCPRLLVLQEQLPAEASAMLYEELAGGTSEIRPLVERVVAAAPEAFDESRIQWWNWPDQQVAAAAAPNEQQRRIHDAVMKRFEAPFEREPITLDQDFTEALAQPGLTQADRDYLWAQRQQMEYDKMKELQESGDSEKLFGLPSSRLLKTRLSQVEGSSDRNIIQQLQKIRNKCLDDALSFSVPAYIDRSGTRSIPIPEAIQRVNQQATGSSLYWIGICQMDRGQPGTAITSFANYRRQYPDGAWFYPSLLNQAVAEYNQGRLDAAAESLREADQEDNPERRHVQTLLKRMSVSGSAGDPEPVEESASEEKDASEPSVSEEDSDGQAASEDETAENTPAEEDSGEAGSDGADESSTPESAETAPAAEDAPADDAAADDAPADDAE